MNSRKDGEKTRLRILEVACKLFAEKGYRNTIHEEICRLANVNIGAINYHFRSKEKLYVEAWKHSFHQSLMKHPIDGGVSPGASPEERLHGRIVSIMHRISDTENREFDIVHKEMANPTGLLAEVMRESLDPLQKDLQSIVHELLGEKATDVEIHLCEMSVTGQCFNPIVMHKCRMAADFPAPHCPDFDIETIISHVVRFSLAGIREIRRQLEERGK